MRNYEQTFEDFAKTVEENFRRDGHIAPLIFIENRKGRLIGIDATKGWEDKDSFTRWLQHVLKRVKARMIVTISEAWMRRLDGNQRQKYEGPVSKDLDREEVVILTLETFDTQFIKIWKVGEVMGMRVLIQVQGELPEGLTFESRFSGDYFLKSTEGKTDGRHQRGGGHRSNK